MNDIRKYSNKNQFSREIHSIKLSYCCRFMFLVIAFTILTNNCINYFQTLMNCTSGHSYFNRNGKSLVKHKITSSVWCSEDPSDNNHRTCLFKNLCWLPSEEQFVFFLSDESIISGLVDRLGLSSLDFSSVAGHNRFLLKLTVLPTPLPEQHPLSQYAVYEENEWVYLIWRFKPDNIMHVFHDDLLPLFYTYEGICGGDVKYCVDKYKLIFVDDVPSGSNYDLYKIFSNENGEIGDGGPVFLKRSWRTYPNSSICFRHARIGLSRETLWYQYGFGKPQGAIKNSNLSMAILRNFGQFLMQQMEITMPDRTEGISDSEDAIPPRALYISRSISRRILNELDVINATNRVYSEVIKATDSLKVDYLNPFPNSSSSGIKEMLKTILAWPPPRLLFGMHGAALTVASLLCLATQVGYHPLAILELFPMGINPVAVSPVRALMKLPFMKNSNHLIYESWTNQDPLNSIMPSVSSDPLHGGGLMCKGLDLSSVLPAVHCCHNQEYICRMFQDTKVDLGKEYSEKLRFLFLQQGKFKQVTNAENGLEFQWYFPASVTNIVCVWNLATEAEHLKLSWQEPLNTYKLSYHYVIALILKSEVIPKEVVANKENENGFLSENFSSSLPEKQNDYFMSVSNSEAFMTIPQDFLDKPYRALKAFIWIQCVVVIDYNNIKKHVTSVDTYQECSVSL